MTAAALLTDQNIWVVTPLPEGTLVLEEMSGRDSLGAPFSYELGLRSRDPNIDLASLLGKPMTVYVTLEEGERQFNGIVTHVALGASTGDMSRYRVTLRPWLSLLAYNSNCRIFQHKSAVDVIKEVFRDNGFSDIEDALTGTYAPLEFCVQYRESDLNFVSRLMEHEGIYYYFKHANEKHTLVLADGYSAHSTADGYETIPFKPPHDFQLDEDCLDGWTVAQQLRPGSFSTTDYDFTRPRADLFNRLNSPSDNPQAYGALYDFPGDFLTADAGATRVKIRLQEQQVAGELVQAAGNARGIGSGTLFTLTDFNRDDQNKEYLVVSAEYDLHAAILETGAGRSEEDFRSHLTLMDSQTPFRPGLHAPKPRVEGPQTALVVGQAGDEITTDQYGRVKVQFYWDRVGTKTEKSSCWVRVAQLWAGSGWGGMHLPRIGQEVIVDFLEGDPDRPIITGRVYNADNMPPYKLPDNKSQSGIKSRSTLSGSPSNFNEIRFEDKKGSEELFVQAEKDQNTTVKNNQSLSVGAARTKSVGADETVSIGANQKIAVSADQTVTVGGNRTETVTGNETITVNQNRNVTIAVNETIAVGSAYSLTVGATMTEAILAAKSVTVGGLSAEEVGGAKTVTVGGSISESAGLGVGVNAGRDVALAAGKSVVAQAGENVAVTAGKKASITAADELTLVCGDATIVLKKNGDITINGKKLQVTASGDLVLKGSKIASN